MRISLSLQDDSIFAKAYFIYLHIIISDIKQIFHIRKLIFATIYKCETNNSNVTSVKKLY